MADMLIDMKTEKKLNKMKPPILKLMQSTNLV